MRDTAIEESLESVRVGIILDERTCYRRTRSDHWIVYGRYLTNLYPGSLARTGGIREGGQTRVTSARSIN